MRYLLTSLLCVFTLSLTAQVPSYIESCEYDPSGERWFVSCGSSTLLSTSDLGESWDYFGNANASHGMEVMNGVLFVIHNNQVYAYDLNTTALLGSLSITGASFLNGMGSDGNGTLVISDFATGRILKIDASDPANMSTSILVGNTGSTPNGVVVDVANGRAVVVNWGNNADILAIDLETGELSTLVNESGLGNCDGIDIDSYGNFYISSWSPARITKYNSDFSTSVTVVSSGLSNPSDISFDEVNNMLGVANSGTNIVEFYLFEGCMDTTACNYDEVATQDDGSCLEDDDCGVCGGDNSTCSGCTDIESCNYNSEATLDDGSCEYPADIFSQDYVDCDGICINDADLDGVCDELDMCIGNYHDFCGICNGPGAIYECGCVDMPDGDCDCDGNVLDECGVCGGDGSSCIQCLDDDDAVSAVGGCVNAVDVLGCAFYWNDVLISELCPESCDNCPCDNDFNDNGICDDVEVFGCTYPDAMNFDSLATADDGSCLYDDVSSDCPSDIDGDGTVTTQDLLSFLSFFGEVCE
jgi:hypothetical protein